MYSVNIVGSETRLREQGNAHLHATVNRASRLINTVLWHVFGLQVFNCQKQAVEGGASIYVDGFAVAERLRTEHPDAFEFLTKTSFMYQSFDDGYHYIADGPVFELGPLGNVQRVSHLR